MSYGKYKALAHDTAQGAAQATEQKEKPTKRRYTHEEAFALWQAGKSDLEIGRALGVSRQIIQRWRDTLELPSTQKTPIDTKRYRLVVEGGEYFIIRE